MKRLAVLFAVALLLLGFSSQAMASWSNGDLIQVVYQSGGQYEEATDLGAFNLTTAYSGATTTFSAPAITLAGQGVFSGATWDKQQIAYFIATGTSYTAWTSGPSTGQSTGTSRQWGPFQTQGATIMNKYASLNTGAQGTLPQSDLQSYFLLMDKQGSQIGSFYGMIAAGNGETNMAALANPGGYVDSYLYYYANANSNTQGVQVADLRTFSNGTTQLVGTATPVPAPALLFGSGLLGLIGLRRKESV